jgi:hypothetical protein
MHAILGFAASELIPTDPSFAMAAMTHRVKAIRSIKKRLSEASRASTSYEEANALVATCYALTFQSISLEDGLAEYMTFIRGIVIVGMQMMFGRIKPIFDNMFEQDSESVLAPYMDGLPLIQRGWVDSAVDSLTSLRQLCTEQLEIEYADKLLATAQPLYTNSFEGEFWLLSHMHQLHKSPIGAMLTDLTLNIAYKASTKVYAWWMFLPHATFQNLIKPNSQIILLLHAHWIALTEVMSFILQQEREARAKAPQPQPKQPDEKPDIGFVRWLRYLNARVDYEHQIYNQWPMWVDEQLEKDITFFGKRL